MEKLDFGKKGIMILILELAFEEYDKRGFFNLKRAILTVGSLLKNYTLYQEQLLFDIGLHNQMK